jgi:hypothetical protein
MVISAVDIEKRSPKRIQSMHNLRSNRHIPELHILGQKRPLKPNILNKLLFYDN